jgi:hypothetical protein
MESVMNTTTERLTALRADLERSGVVDVKFYFNKRSLSELAPSEVAAKVADFLECYMSGKGTKVDAIGDTPAGVSAAQAFAA